MYQKDNKAACVDVNFFKKRGRKAPFYAAYVAVNPLTSDDSDDDDF